jgi:hypothetical protein
MSIRKSVATWIVLVLAASPALAQEPATRPADWPDATTVVQQILDGGRSLAITRALATCPQDNPYGDTVWSALLTMDLPRQTAVHISAAWTIALRSCDDPRMKAWFRAWLLRAEHIFEADPFLVGPLTPEYVDFLKERLVYDETRSEGFRSEILQMLAGALPLDERIELYLEAMQRTGSVPFPYIFDEWWSLFSGRGRDAFVHRSLEVMFRLPTRNAAYLLGLFATREEVWGAPGLRAGLEAAVQTILTAPAGTYPQEMVNAATSAVDFSRRLEQP